MAEQVIYAMYDDDDVLKDGAKKLVGKGVHINEVFSPFPIHGIDPIIGVKNTRLGIMAFLYGLTGLMLATIGMRFFMVVDWPMNIGGNRISHTWTTFWRSFQSRLSLRCCALLMVWR